MSGSPRIIAAASGIAEACVALEAGAVVAIPTESSYGLAVDARNEAAIDELHRLKGRGPDRYFPLLVADRAMLARYAILSAEADALISAHWPGPLTLVLPSRDRLPSVLTNRRGRVGFRASSDGVASALVTAFGAPITATSANVSGSAPATSAPAAAIAGVALALDAGLRRGLASTVVEIGDRGQVTLLRSGPVTVAS